VNRGQKEYYKRDYAQAKAEGKPFFPYAIYKDHTIALLAVVGVVAMAIWQRVEVGEPVNPATTDFIPRPEWYFLFLFELLKIFEGQNVFTPVIMATFIVPNIFMILLIALPFIDRGPERRIHKRPVAMATAVLVIGGLAYLTYLGAETPTGVADEIEFTNLTPEAEAGLELYLASGCASCHMIKGEGAAGPGPDLTNEGQRGTVTPENSREFFNNPPGAMPAFAGFTDQEYEELGAFLAGLGTEFQ
jgi:menaquinol-cytochrome c reductase cytochrome b/c subunit